MENNPKKSKALIITIIVIIVLIIAGYLIFKNRDVFGVKTSASIAKIFSPLISSKNSTDLNTTDENSTKALAQAGENIKKGDSVSVFGTGANSNGNPIVVKSGSKGSNRRVFGFANQDINNGDIGEVVLNSSGSNTFWNSFSDFIGGILGGNKVETIPTPPVGETGTGGSGTGTWENGNGTDIFQCTKDGVVIDCFSLPDLVCKKDGVVIDCFSLPDLVCKKDGVVIDCSTLGEGTCPGGQIDYPVCSIMPGTGSDLTAGNVTPTNTTINTPTTLYSMITNAGGGGTGYSFSSFFTISITGKTNVELSVIIPTLESKMANEAKVLYSFSSAGVYSIRACADKKSGSDAGTVIESNEGNNCGPWITFTVTDSLPTTGDDITPPPITPPGDVITPPAEVNKCLVIEQNPLTFTPEEKARLAVLLRKFYLISSTLKTTEDISTIYNEIDQQKNFISQIKDLTGQCYAQTDNMMLTNGWVRHGNPWYKKTSGGSFPYTSEDTGYLKGGGDLDDTERILNIW